MSGICGVFRYGWSASEEPGRVAAMLEALIHRGPEWAELRFSPDRRMILGERRLDRVPHRSGAPVAAMEMQGELELVWDGEIYNGSELRETLRDRGALPDSDSDADLLLALYRLEGPAMLSRLRGIFALAIRDAGRGELFLARDRLGVKPLYHASADGRFLFASEIRALLTHPALERDLDLDSLYHYLSYSTTPAPGTMFRGIGKLAAGHAMRIEGDGRIQSWRWWDPAAAPAPDSGLLASESAAAEQIRSLLSHAVHEQLPSSPFGILLSGGVDSSAITALAREHHSGPLRTFSVGYRDAPAHDESGPARWVSEHYGTEHTEVLLDFKDLIASLPQLVHAQDEPLADWVCIPLYHLSRLVRDSGVPLALVGEGSDEQFAGYRHYLRYHRLARGLWPAYQRLPGWVRRAVHTSADPLLRSLKLPREIRELVRRSAAGEPLFLSGAVSSWEVEKRELISASLRSGAWARSSSVPLVMESRDRLRAHRPDADLLTEVLYQELQLRVPELLLMRVDKILLSTSLRARVPFLDHRLIEFSMHLPAEMKVRNGRTKHLLKEAVRGLVPDAIIDRRKQGFSAPIKEWFRGPLAGYARRSILESRLRERGLFDYGRLEWMLEAHRSGARNYDTVLWNLVNLSQWHDSWIAGDPARALAAV